MPISGIHHVDLAVRDVERSMAFYTAVLGPLGAGEASRYPTYRGSEEVVYLRLGEQFLGLRPADGGEPATTTSASSTSPCSSTAATRSTRRMSAAENSA